MIGKGTPAHWTTLQKLIWLQALQGGGGGGTITTLTGISPLLLANALAKPLRRLTQFGKCVQNGTPTPSAPVDIACNNGALRMVDDELPTGYKRVLGYECNNDSMWEITGFRLKGSDTVRISFEIAAACNVFGCYQGASANDNYDLYASTSSGSKYFRYGNGTYASYFSSANQNKRFDVVYTPNGSQGMPEDSTWEPMTFESANDLLIGSTTLTGSSSKLKGKLYGNFEVDGRLKLIPCERVSDGVLGYYDTYGATFYEPYTGFDGAVSLGYDGSHYTLGVVGTDEVLTVSADGAATQTVTNLPNLLSVGDYADEVEIISGAVIRKVGIKVFDGTESFGKSSAYGAAFYIQSAVSAWGAQKEIVMCSHYLGLAAAASAAAEGTCFFNASGHFYFRVADNSDTAAFKADLAAKYASGNPVILLYALATETTEQTTPHALHTTAGDNTVDVTSEVGSVELSVEYMAGAA